MVLLKMSMEIALPKMGELLVMVMTMISPSRREVPPMESLRRRARRQHFVPKVLTLFFLGQNDLYTRRGAPEVGRGGHNPRGRAWGAWRAQVGCTYLVTPSGGYWFQYFLNYP